MIDPTIITSMRTAQDPTEAYFRLAQLRDMAAANRIRGLQEQEAQMRLADLRRAAADQDAMRNAYGASVQPGQTNVTRSPEMTLGNFTLPGRDVSASRPAYSDSSVMLSELTKSAPHLVPGVQAQMDAQEQARQKQMLEMQKQIAEIAKTKGEAGKLHLENVKNQLSVVGQMAQSVIQNPALAPQVAQQAIQQGLVGEQDLPPGMLNGVYTPDTEAWLKGHVTQAVEVSKAIDQALEQAKAGESQRHNKATEAATIRGQNMTDARAREANARSAEMNSLKTAELKNQLAQQNRQQEGAAASYDVALGTLSRLKKHKALKDVVGSMNPDWTALPGSERANFLAELEAFKSQTFLPQVQALRGMGQLSDKEGAKLEAAVGALKTTMSPKAFVESLDRIQKQLEAAKNRANSGAQPWYRQPPVSAPTPSAPQQPVQAQPVFANNPQTKQRIVSYDGGQTWQAAQ